MFAELLADLRGLMGGMAAFAGTPLVLIGILLGLFMLWRRTSA